MDTGLYAISGLGVMRSRSRENALEASVPDAGTVVWVNLARRVLFESTRTDDLEEGQNSLVAATASTLFLRTR
jgi:hypothetical protein